MFGKWSGAIFCNLPARWRRRRHRRPSRPAAAAAPAARDMVVHTGTPEDNLFTRIGVRPILNARGTYTIISGSRSLPEVKQAMFEASHYYVQMDEMMDGVGKELARLNGCESAMATNGCEAAIMSGHHRLRRRQQCREVPGPALRQGQGPGHHPQAFAQSL